MDGDIDLILIWGLASCHRHTQTQTHSHHVKRHRSKSTPTNTHPPHDNTQRTAILPPTLHQVTLFTQHLMWFAVFTRWGPRRRQHPCNLIATAACARCQRIPAPSAWGACTACVAGWGVIGSHVGMKNEEKQHCGTQRPVSGFHDESV